MVARYGPKAVCAAGLSLVTVGLAGFMLVGVDTPLWVLIVLTFIQGAGMANVMPPSIESIMASLPREKAGVGSAIQNTVRQVGGALGVAVLGALLSAVYRGEVAPALAGLPPAARSVAGESLAGAYGVAAQAGPAGEMVTAAADQAFVTAMHLAAAGSAFVALLSIAVVLVWLPRRPVPVSVPGAAAGNDTGRGWGQRHH
jgi:MFS family permease